MLFVPHAVSDMAKKMEPHAEAMKAHATGIANVGFDASRKSAIVRAFASRRVSAGRFHCRSIVASTDVWS